MVGRFLEHSRIFYFGNNGHAEIYLGSADMMQRNLNDRVETLFPIEDPVLRVAIRDQILQAYLDDTVNTSELQSDGSYVHVQPEQGKPPFDCQCWFITHPLLEPQPESNEITTSALPSGS